MATDGIHPTQKIYSFSSSPNKPPLSIETTTTTSHLLLSSSKSSPLTASTPSPAASSPSLPPKLRSGPRAANPPPRLHDHFATPSSPSVEDSFTNAKEIFDFVDNFKWRFRKKLVHYGIGNAGLQGQWRRGGLGSVVHFLSFKVRFPAASIKSLVDFLPLLRLDYCYSGRPRNFRCVGDLMWADRLPSVDTLLQYSKDKKRNQKHSL